MNSANRRTIEEVARLQSSHDIDELLALYVDDVVFEDVAVGIVAKGHGEMRKMFDDIYASMPDYRMTLASTVIDDERGGAEWVMSGTYVNDYFPGLPGSDKPFSLRAAASMRFANGQITHWTDYWSTETFKEQVAIG